MDSSLYVSDNHTELSRSKPGLSIAPSVQHAAIGQPLQLVEGTWNEEQFPSNEHTLMSKLIHNAS